MANEKLITLNNLQEYKSKYDNALETGQIIPSKSLSTKAVDNISEESGTTQETPFILQGTGTNNNTDETPTSPVGKQLEKQGNTVCVNQLAQNGNFARTDNWELNGTGTFTVSNNIATVICNVANRLQQQVNNAIIGHKYILSFSVKLNQITESTGFDVRISDLSHDLIVSIDNTITTWQNKIALLNNTNVSGTTYLMFRDNRTTKAEFNIKNVNLIDLTQWFNGDIPQDLLDHPEHWSWYQNYGDYIAYNTGTLVNSDGQYLECGQGRNLWDEETRNGYYDTNGVFNANASYIANKYPIQIIPNRQYKWQTPSGTRGRYCWYDKDMNFISTSTSAVDGIITSPANAFYLNFDMTSTYGSTYKNDITISIYYPTGDSYDQHYPYVAPKVYDTGVEVLRKAGSIKDTKAPDGTITRNVGSVDLSTLNWYYDSVNDNYYSQVINETSIPNSEIGNIVCAKYVACSINDIIAKKQKSICFNRRFYIVDSDLNGDVYNITGTAYYELATPTTEQGTPFSENIEINDYGTMAWLDSNNALVEIPQGCKIFYPADYVLLMDDLNNYCDGDVSKLALKTDVSAEATRVDGLYAIMKENVGGALRHQLSESANIDFNNTAWVDLGSLSWSYFNNRFSAGGFDIKQGTNNVICVKYKTLESGYSTSHNDNNAIWSKLDVQGIWISDTTYIDATTFKNAMKGILLAYEKAS